MNSLSRFRLTETGMKILKTALAAEAVRRKGRTVEQWTEAEASAMWNAAQGFAQQHGLRAPLLEDVVRVERLARGHSDYSSKWALYVAELMMAGETVSA